MSRAWKPTLFPACLFATMSLTTLGSPAIAQDNPSTVGLPDVPTTRVLAVGHLTAKANPAAMRSAMANEVGDTVRLYLNGKVTDWYVRKDQPGVVFILDVHDVADARKLLAELPLGRGGLMDFDLVPLGPLAPLGLLLPKH